MQGWPRVGNVAVIVAELWIINVRVNPTLKEECVCRWLCMIATGSLCDLYV